MKILTVFGTRPEAIKIAPVVTLFKKQKNLRIRILLTGQHKLMLGQVMESLSGTFSENEGSPCLDGECISINWITPGSVWSMDIESDGYCDDSNSEETSDTTQESCEANGDGYDWYSESCTQSVYTKE